MILSHHFTSKHMGAESAKMQQVSPEELYDQFKQSIRATQNSIRKQISNIEMEENMIKMDMKKYA